MAASERSGPGLWLPEEEGVGPWLYWPDEKPESWEVLSLVDVKHLQVLPAAGSSPGSASGGERLRADDVVVSGSSQVADHPSETTTASMDQHGGMGPELGNAGNSNRLYFSDLEKGHRQEMAGGFGLWNYLPSLFHFI